MLRESNCRRKEVRSVTIHYQCERFHVGQPITVVLSALTVARCGACGEMVFTYDTEEPINFAYRTETDAPQKGCASQKERGTRSWNIAGKLMWG